MEKTLNIKITAKDVFDHPSYSDPINCPLYHTVKAMLSSIENIIVGSNFIGIYSVDHKIHKRYILEKPFSASAYQDIKSTGIEFNTIATLIE